MSDAPLTSKELLPCPFCAGAGRLINSAGCWFVTCDDCDADTGWRESSEDATALWNARASVEPAERERILLGVIDEAAACLRNNWTVRACYELEHAREMLRPAVTKSAACTCPGTFPPDPGCHYSNCPAGETSAALKIGDPCPACASGRIGNSQGHFRCGNCGWLGPKQNAPSGANRDVSTGIEP